MRKVCVAVCTSRRKKTMPLLRATMARTKNVPTTQRRLLPQSASMNSAAIKAHTSSADRAPNW